MALVLESRVAWKQRRGRLPVTVLLLQKKTTRKTKSSGGSSRCRRALGVETQRAALRRGDEVVLALPSACQQDF